MKLRETKFPGFYHCKDYPGLAASMEGVIIDAYTGEEVGKTNVLGYVRVRHEGRDIAAHHVVLSTFREKPMLPEGSMLVGNHLDGVKDNNRLDNLEWTSQSQNTYHAYRTGLNWKAKTVWIKDLRTGEITEHYSMRDAAKCYGIPHTQISKWFRTTRQWPLMKYYDAATHGMEFVGFTSEDAGKSYVIYGGLVLISPDGDKYHMESTVMAATMVGVSYATLSHSLCHGDKMFSRNGWKAWWTRNYPGDVNECKYIPKEPRPKTGGLQRFPVKVVFEDGTHKVYPDRFALAEEHKVHPTTISTAISKGGDWHGLKLEYVRPN